MNRGNSVIIAVLVVAVIVIVGWLAYSQGFFEGKDKADDGIQIQLGGSSDSQ